MVNWSSVDVVMEVGPRWRNGIAGDWGAARVGSDKPVAAIIRMAGSVRWTYGDTLDGHAAGPAKPSAVDGSAAAPLKCWFEMTGSSNAPA